MWETDFYTPPMLGGAALSDNSAPAVYTISASSGTGFVFTAGTELLKGQHLPALEVYKIRAVAEYCWLSRLVSRME